MTVEEILDMCDNMEQLASLIDRAAVLHEDIADEFIAPIRSADEKQDFKTVLMCATANSYRASVKADILNSLLSEAQTMAYSLAGIIALARKEQHEKGITIPTLEDATPAKGTE